MGSEKAALRAQARALGAPPVAAANACLARLLALEELARAGCLVLFAGEGAEPPVERIQPLLRSRGWTTAFPRVVADGLELGLVECVDELVAGWRGLREPDPGAQTLSVSEVDVFVVPGVLFARNGARLGRGGGHYDRLLARAAPGALRIGICYADRVRDALPVDPHDAFVDVIVTELEVLRTGARTPGGDA